MLKRLPNFNDIVSVYAVIASMLFAWSLLLFFWYLPSWLHFMTLGDVIAVFSYVMASSFIESLSFLLFLLLLCFSLPAKYLRNEFIARGTSITLCVIGLIMIYFRINNANVANILFSRTGIGLSLAAVAISLLLTKIHRVRWTLISLSDRLIIFLYILIPLSFFSLLVIIIRNII
jgi:hypothetical protein